MVVCINYDDEKRIGFNVYALNKHKFWNMPVTVNLTPVSPTTVEKSLIR
jgi:hypothetical protein